MPSWPPRSVCGKFVFVFIGAGLALGAASSETASLYVVTVPVANLRSQPSANPTSAAHDEAQETQLLFGERVKVLKHQDTWALVEAIEQPEYTHQRRWQGYPGWMLRRELAPVRRLQEPNAIVLRKWATLWRDAHMTRPWLSVPLGTKLVVSQSEQGWCHVHLPDGDVAWIAEGDVQWLSDLTQLSPTAHRQLVLRMAEIFLGDTYFWGGRSPGGTGEALMITGVDCSGLVNLAYRAANLKIPRDAHEQYLRARPVSRPQPADLVFLSSVDDRHRIVHVMLYAGEGWLLEGPGTGGVVRRIRVTERLGRPIEALHPGDRIDGQTVFFGAYLP